MEGLSIKLRRDFATAIDSVTATISAHYPLKSLAIQKIFLSVKPNVLEDIVRLKHALEHGDPAQKDAARTQLELLDLLSKKLNSENYNSKEVEAIKILLEMDLMSMPNAVPVIKNIIKLLKEGKTMQQALDQGLVGRDGKKINLDDFIRLCLGK